MLYLFMLHEFFLLFEFLITLFTFESFKKMHYRSFFAFCMSQQFLQIWPSIDHCFFGLYLMIPIFAPHMLQKFRNLLYSISLLSKQGLQRRPFISHCHLGSHRSGTFFSIPQIMHFCLMLKS